MLFSYYMFIRDYHREPWSIADFFDGLCARAVRIDLENPDPPKGWIS